ncbi:unnamed protein product, partial [Anisakis simplex]|uniref:Putative peroxidasin (inferred by orthology to a S. mansoni protein) n=1 Tax=Anisakis simplex TaxID=6269 RepID=A0A0M3J3L6_ANISI
MLQESYFLSVVRGLDMKQSYSGDYELFLNGTMRIDDPDEIRHFECAIDHSVLPQRKRRQLHTSSFEPQFTLRPQNRAYREGDVVRVDCEVIGKPRPKIKWYFNKVELRPSSKHEMNFERTNLIIRAFTDRDVGEYSCVAENVVGRIEASASIELIASSPPVIAEGPESQTVDEGATVHFKCKAKAQPRPAITWFFEGSEISMLRGHFHVSDDESELTVSRVTKQDDGTYSCMAGNAVGSMLADARLTVIPNPQISRPTHHQQLSRPSPPQQSFRPTHHHPQSSRPTHPQQSSHPTHHQHRQHQQYQSPPNPPPPSYRQSITNSITDDIIRDA